MKPRPPSTTPQGRPTGVVILAILEVLTGVVFLLGGTALLTGKPASFAFMKEGA